MQLSFYINNSQVYKMIKSNKTYRSINNLKGSFSGDYIAGYIAGTLTAFNFGYLANTNIRINHQNIEDLKLALDDYIVITAKAIDQKLMPNFIAWWIREDDETFILYNFKSKDFEEGFNKVFNDLELNPSTFTIGKPFTKQIRIESLVENVPYYTGAYEVDEFDYE
jgi:hypothetical protein